MSEFSIQPEDKTPYTQTQPDSTTCKVEVTIDVMNGLIKRQTKNERRVAKENGQKISKREARQIAERKLYSKCSIMSEEVQNQRKQEFYNELCLQNQNFNLGFSEAKLSKAADSYDPSAVSYEHKVIAGQKKHTGTHILKKLLSNKFLQYNRESGQ